MGCQSAIAQKIIAQKADYVMALKGNQKKRHKAVATYCHEVCLNGPGARMPDYDAFDDKHGRVVRRRGWVLPVTEELPILHGWPSIANIILIETIRSVNSSHKIR